jgi:uncharacterized protein YacL
MAGKNNAVANKATAIIDGRLTSIVGTAASGVEIMVKQYAIRELIQLTF